MIESGQIQVSDKLRRPSRTIFEHDFLELFNAVEISPVREKNGDCERIQKSEMWVDTDAKYFWSVYLHYDASHPNNKNFGGTECVVDLPTEQAAMAFADGLQSKLAAIVGDRLIRRKFIIPKSDQLRDEYISVVMSAELLVFCKANGLPFIDAAELVMDNNLTDFQFGWLMSFNRLWESLL